MNSKVNQINPVLERAVPGQPVVDGADWCGRTIENRSDWIYSLSEPEIRDLRAMVSVIREQYGDDPNALLSTAQQDYDLGVFADKVDQIKHQIKDGLGFALIRGLPVEHMDELEAATIYWGIGRHLGNAVSNNPGGDMLCPIMNFGVDINDPKNRGYMTGETMDYHTDQSDVVSLLCLQVPKSGGRSKIASSIALYNTLLQRRPDLMEVLMEPFCWTMHGEIDAGRKTYYETPVFNFLDGKLCTAIGPMHIRKGHALPEAPDLTELQSEAITVAEGIFEELHYSMELQRGDIQIVNNSVMTHTREAFEDWPEPERKRRLLRMWLEIPGFRPLTPFLKHWRGGLKTDGTAERIKLSAYTEALVE